MNQRVGRVLSHFTTFLLLIFSSLFAFAGPGKTTYQAKIVKPDGYPLEVSSVNFKFTILDPAGSCILYAETYSSVNMSGTGGLISFALGSGVKTYPASATTFEQVFSNITPSLSCDTGGPVSYSPAASDIRKIVMQFHDGSGWQTLPAMSINAVPYAMYANDATKLNGLTSSDFVQVSTVPTCAASEALRYTGAGFTCVAVGNSVTSGTVVTALGYTPADSVSVTALSSNVSSVSSTVFSVSSTVTSLQNSMAASFSAITSSQWTTSGTNIFYNTGNIGIGTTTPVTKLDVSGGVRIGAEGTTCAPALAGTLRYNASNVEYCNGTSWSAFGVATSGITSLNGAASQTQSFANGTLGTAPAFNTTNGVHTLNIPLASTGSVTAGLISNTDYTTFTNKITSSAASIAQVLGYIPADNAVSGTYAQKANNLSDLTNVATARTNLGLGTFATASSIDLGSASATGTLAIARLPSFMGDATIATASNTIILSNSGVTAGTHTKVTVDAKGRVTSSAALASSDVTAALGYTPANSATTVSSQWTTSGTNIFYNTGNIGIGTTTPVTKLDVSGGVRIGAEGTTCAPALAGTLRYNASNVEYCNGTSWQAFGVSGAGITNINGSTSGTQSFATGTGGTAPNINTLNGVHTLNLPLANTGSVTAGLISNTDYTTFTNKITSSAASIAQVLGYIPADNSVSGTYAQKANNLSDLTNVATARTNLGLGTFATASSIDLGSASATGTLAIARLPNFTGDATITAASNTIILSNSGVTAGTYTKVTVDAKGRVTSSAALASSDVTTALGYTPANSATTVSSQWITNGTNIYYNTGNVGIGTTNPSAKLHLSAGTSITAALKFTSGTLLTAAQSGSMEYDGFNFYVTDSTNTRRAIATGSSAGTIDNASNINSAGNINLTPTGSVIVSSTTTSTNSSTGALVVKGGLGVAENLNVAGTISGSAKVLATGFRANQEAPDAADNSTNGYAFGADGDTGMFSPGSGSANGVLAFYSNNSEKVRITNSGNVGIGTTTPAAKLDVSGSAFANTLLLGVSRTIGGYAAPNETTAGVKGTILFGSNTTDEASIFSEVDVGLATGLVLQIKDDANDYIDLRGTTNSLLRVMNSGNVGIGTTAPESKLHVSAGAILLDNNYALKGKADNGTAYDLISVATDGSTRLRGFHGTDLIQGVNGATYLYSSGGGGTTMTLLGGNVGIGTTAPDVKLEVAGNGRFNMSAASTLAIRALASNPTDAGDIVFENNDGSNRARIHANAGGTGELRFGVLDIDRMTILNTGNVGIGTSNPGSRLHIATPVSGGVNNRLVSGNSNGDLIDVTGVSGDSFLDHIVSARYTATASTTLTKAVTFKIDGAPTVSGTDLTVTEKLAFWVEAGTSSFGGNVGIGTTNPISAKLHLQSSPYGGTPADANNRLKIESSGHSYIGLYSPNTFDQGIHFGDPEGEQVGRITYRHSTDMMQFRTNAAERMVIDSSGNVGIGTTAPAAKLEVAGDIVGQAQVFRAYLSAPFSKSVSWEKIPFNVTYFNTLQGTFDTINNRFTASRSGYYQVGVSGYSSASSASGDRYAFALLKNGVQETITGGNYSAVDTPFAPLSTIVYMNGTTDYIEIHMYSAIAATLSSGATGYGMQWNMSYLGK